MKKTFLTLAFGLTMLIANAQNFQLNFATFEKYLIQNFTPEKVKTSVAPNYLLVKQSETEWKFRDENKSWEALLYVQLDKTTKAIKEIQFVAPNNRVYELMDELEKNLGYKLMGTQGQMDIYENSSKKLGAKIVPADFLGNGLVLFRLYRL